MVRRRAIGVLLVLIALATVACRSRHAPAPVAPAPLPTAPAGLLAELSVRNPAALYAALRASSGLEERLPLNAGFVLAGAGGLPLSVAASLVLDQPMRGVLLGADDGGLSLVAGCRVQSGAQVRQELTSGAPPRQVAPDSTGGLAVFRGAAGPVLGVYGDWLLAASDEAALRSAGPYVAATLSRREPAPEAFALEVGTAALRGPLDRTLRSRWQRSRAELTKLASDMQAVQGRPPDWGDPATILAKADGNVSTLLTILAGSDGLRLTLTAGPQELELLLDVAPTPGGSVEASLQGLGPVTLEPLLTLPGDTQLALVTRLSARDLGVGEGPAAVAVERLLGGMDDVTTLALMPGPGVVLRRHVQTGATPGQALSELMRPLEDALAKGALGPSFGKPRASKVSIPALGIQAERLQTTLQAGVPAAGRAPPGEPVDLLAAIQSEVLLVAVTSKDARPLLLSYAKPPPGTELGKNAEVSALLSRHAGASTALVANLAAALRASRPATALFTWGRREQHVHGSLALTPGALALLGGLVAR